MKPVVLLVGADKGGVGKTTVTRTVLDYLTSKNMPTRAFDTEHPRGTLKRFHPVSTEVIDITDVADQMKMLDTLHTSDVKVSVIDIRAGLLSNTLQALTDVGFFDMVRNGEFNFGLLHELAGVPFSTFAANRNPQGLPGTYSLVLRGYVRTWLNQISAEYDRVGLVDRLSS